MTVAEIGTTLCAALALPISVLAAWWTRRSGDRAADAALSAGHDQADAAIAAVRLQQSGGREAERQSVLAAALSRFLRTVDELEAVVGRLPSIDHELRAVRVAEHGAAVQTAFGALELLAPPDLLGRAGDLLKQCRKLEELALDRAVLRTVVAAVFDGACKWDDPETCDVPEHGSAWVALELLEDWPDKAVGARREERDLLEFCLLDSGRVPPEEVAGVLALADRCPAAWRLMISGAVLPRDLLLERFAWLRAEFMAAARPLYP
ncbi:hypothetical protein [Kitasatospora sp. NPDC004272]